MRSSCAAHTFGSTRKVCRYRESALHSGHSAWREPRNAQSEYGVSVITSRNAPHESSRRTSYSSLGFLLLGVSELSDLGEPFGDPLLEPALGWLVIPVPGKR